VASLNELRAGSNGFVDGRHKAGHDGEGEFAGCDV
jgi:hypothetical protein